REHPRLAAPVRDFLEGMAENVFGIFEVVAVTPGEGMSISDLLTGREFAVSEEEAAALVEGGGNVVGGVFPAAEEEYFLSGAVGCFRSPPLLQALGDDLARARAASPTARLSQREIERLLWPVVEAPGEPTSEEALRVLLAEASLPGLDFEGVR